MSRLGKLVVMAALLGVSAALGACGTVGGGEPDAREAFDRGQVERESSSAPLEFVFPDGSRVVVEGLMYLDEAGVQSLSGCEIAFLESDSDLSELDRLEDSEDGEPVYHLSALFRIDQCR
jgi:hypothetical protein